MRPYEEMVSYYNNIISNIWKEIEEVYPNEYLGDFRYKYSDEWTHAYGYLQRAEWRLSDTYNMKDYYTEENFKYYGMEHLSDVNNRIKHYLEDTDFKFTEKVTDCHKYDNILEERMELLHDPEFHKYFNYYEKLNRLNTEKKHITGQINYLKSQIVQLEEELNGTWTLSQHNKYIQNTDELLKIITEIKEKAEKLQPEYIEITLED